MITLSNVNIGSGPGIGDGDPIRTAFSKINNNFTIVQNNVNLLTNSVTSVAGRTGNVVLTVNDIIGFNGLGLISNVPAHSSSLGVVGQVATDSSYLYLCIAANTWVRSSITTSF